MAGQWGGGAGIAGMAWPKRPKLKLHLELQRSTHSPRPPLFVSCRSFPFLYLFILYAWEYGKSGLFVVPHTESGVGIKGVWLEAEAAVAVAATAFIWFSRCVRRR